MRPIMVRMPVWKRVTSGLVLGLLQTASPAQTIYRSTGADGHTTFSDIPSAQAIRTDPRSNPTEMPAMLTWPSSLRSAVLQFPVTLYATRDCTPCDNARQMLRGRGIPFNEKSVETPQDIAAFVQLSGSNTLPMLSIGAQQLKGYSEPSWQQYLDVAGYPQSKELPSNYRYPLPTPLAVIAPTAKPVPTDSTLGGSNSAPPSPAPSNPAGIRF